MEVKVRLACSKEEFFKILIESILYDIKQATGHQLELEKLKKGYTYQKQLYGHKNKKLAEITIDEFIYPQCYALTFKTSKGINVARYTLCESDDEHIMVIYQEQFKSHRLVWLNQLFASMTNKQQIKSKKAMFKNMESYIINNRNKL
ncbi:MAG: DUF3284 domain-containing protein [Erysipelotrichaceae bacterium]|nr:DUF3284 domain-containing protein [Erysipelotrichaceae bacterium]MDY5252586.1 DUF3284 domain-containing protein [Erysipelotrichaceae bacterium]